MGVRSWSLHSACGVVLAAVVGWVVLVAPARAEPGVIWIGGAHPKGTPTRLDKVGVLEIGPRGARNVLVLEPGAGAGAGRLVPLAQTVVKEVSGWQVWLVERRTNLLEDQSVLNRAKRGRATARQVFDYYLRWTTDKNITHHVQPVADSDVAFARQWGMSVAVQDLRRVITAAAKKRGRVVLGGHSLGAAITTAYATWDFNGKPGVNGLAGLVFSDGGTSPNPVAATTAQGWLRDLQKSSPWTSDGGSPAPFGGLFLDVSSALAKMDPGGQSLLQRWNGLPADLNPPVRVTNEALFGFAMDTQTSPSSLVTLQVHAGHLAASGDPRRWVRGGELTPIQRYATMVAGWGLQGTDGTEWYQPTRLFYDWFAVADGNPNPAQRVLDVKAIHGNDIHVPIYAFSTSYGPGVLANARTLAQQSHLPRHDLTLIDRSRTYAHNDPNAAYPNNAFINYLVPFLKHIAKR